MKIIYVHLLVQFVLPLNQSAKHGTPVAGDSFKLQFCLQFHYWFVSSLQPK